MSNTNQDEWLALIAYAEKHGLKVVLVPPAKLLDYAAMNDKAAQRIGYPMPKNEIWIDKSLPLATRVRTLKHELIERNLMGEGQSYWEAHVIATRRERKRLNLR